MVLSLGKLVHILVVIMGCFLIVGIAMAGICPWDSDPPSEISMGYIDAMITTAGSVKGHAGYDSFSMLSQSTDLIGETVSTKELFGRGLISYASTNHLTSDGIEGEYGAMLGTGRLIVSDFGYVSGCTNTTNVTNTTTIQPYCEKMMSKVYADLSEGQFGSTMKLTPILPSGGITHIAAVEGNGMAGGEAMMHSITGVNKTVYNEISISDKVLMIGSDLTFARDVKLSSKR